jgi:Uma2 family endonuclease
MADLLHRPSDVPPSDPLGMPPLRQGDHLDRATFHERYEAMPPGTRAELIDGVVYMPSPATSLHGRPNAHLVTWLGVYEAHTPGVGTLDNTSLILTQSGEPQPDAMLAIDTVCGGGTFEDERGWVHGVPELVAEIAHSSESYDLHSKKRMYERLGVGEYVVNAVQERRIWWWVLEGGTFREIAADADGLMRSRLFPGLWLDHEAMAGREIARVLGALQQGLDTEEHARFVAELALRRKRAPER